MISPHKNIGGLSGLELVTMAGWPYHGRTVAEYNGGALVKRQLEGHSQFSAHVAPLESLNHYPVRIANAPAGGSEWGYHFLHGADLLVGSLGYGEVPCAHSATGEQPLMMGVPLKTPEGILRLCVLKGNATNEIVLLDLKTGYYKTVSVSFNTGGNYRYTVIEASTGRTAMLTLSQMSAANTASMPVFKTSVLDFYENKALISIEATGYAQSLSGIPDDTNHRYYMSGKEASQNHAYEKGRSLLSVLQLTASGIDIDDVSVSVLHGTGNIEGSISRVSPAQPTKDGTVTTYNWSTTVTGSILDAWYDANGFVQLMRGDYKHTRNATSRRLPSNIGDDLFTVICESNCKIYSPQGTVNTNLKHEWKYDLDTTSATCKVWRNGALMSDQVAYEYNIRSWEVKGSHQRAPWPGDEMRYITLGEAYAYADQYETFKPEIYTFTSRNNGTKTHTNYGVIESFIRGSSMPMIKRVFVDGIVSRAGTASIPNFTDTVEWDDPRYIRPQGANVFHMRGYVGAITRAIMNPVTGQLSGGTVARPISFYNFR